MTKGILEMRHVQKIGYIPLYKTYVTIDNFGSLILRAFGSFASKSFELFDFNIGFHRVYLVLKRIPEAWHALKIRYIPF